MWAVVMIAAILVARRRLLRGGGTRGAEVLAGLHDPLGHALLGRLPPRTRVVGLLVADLTVHFEHTVVVGEHVGRDRTGERVLGVGVDVHLHHAVVERRPD